eukprot:358526-Chlamydomonas_euryale.AAC.6
MPRTLWHSVSGRRDRRPRQHEQQQQPQRRPEWQVHVPCECASVARSCLTVLTGPCAAGGGRRWGRPRCRRRGWDRVRKVIIVQSRAERVRGIGDMGEGDTMK